MNTNNTRTGIDTVRAAWADRSDPEGIRPLARVFWRVLLAGVIVGAVSVIVAAALLFLGSMSALAPADTLPLKRNQRLDRTKLDEVVAQIEARQAAFAARKIPVTIPPDPSI